jgi:MFS family permease
VGVFAVAGPAAGHAADRWGARPIITGGLVLLLAGTVLHLFLPGGQSAPTRAVFTLVIVAQAVMGLGAALFGSPNTSLAMQSVSPAQRGVASGLLWTTSFVGQAFGTTLAAILLNTGATALAPVEHQGRVFATLAALLVVAIWLSWQAGLPAPGADGKPANIGRD